MSRLVRAKAKADRAAAKLAAAGTSGAPVAEPSLAPATDPEGTPAGAVTPVESQLQESDDTTPAPAQPNAPVDRIELFRANPKDVGRFMTLLVPILVDVYAASVIIAVRMKTLNGLLKAISFLDSDGIQKVLKVGPDSLRKCFHFFRILICLSVRSHRHLRVFHSVLQRSPFPCYFSPSARGTPPC